MKHLYLIGGTMGVGKTTTCRSLQQMLRPSVFLDGDWLWDMNPFQVTHETRQMVLGNICACLCNFLQCSAHQYILFCWVMHEQAIIDQIVSRLPLTDCKLHSVSLVCSKQALTCRVTDDIASGARSEDSLPRSIARLPLYQALDTLKLDTSEITPEQAAAYILRHC